jgi:hydroxypyruvate isomerase
MNTNRMERGISRRGVLAGALGAATLGCRGAVGNEACARVVTKGRIKQSVCAWCFTKTMSLAELAPQVAAMGVKSIELVDPKDFGILKKHGLMCAITGSHGFVRGFNHKENHAWAADIVQKRIDACAESGICPTIIVFSGFSKGLPADVGLENTVEGLKKVIGHAEKKNITLCLEVLNTRVAEDMKGHPDYMCNNVEWAVEVCRRVGSPRMTLLFDIYHIQVMQGDVITRIRKFHPYVGHYHTAGVPGRNEIGADQELNYPAIMRVIAETGYRGFVGQEFIPTRDPMQSLREAIRICDV